MEAHAARTVKRLFDESSVLGPIHLDTLNSILIICLGAYMIAQAEESPALPPEKSYTYRYWRQMMDGKRTIMAQDLIYDVIRSNVPKDVRDAVNELLRNTVAPETESRIAYALLEEKPRTRQIREVVEYMVPAYYPSLIIGTVSTPNSINRLCVELLAPVNGSYYDGTAGLGSTCIEAGSYAEKHKGKLHICAQETVSVLCAVASLRAYIAGLDFTIQQGDVLKNPGYLEDRRIKQFDYSIMFPPQGSAYIPDRRVLHYDSYERFYPFFSGSGCKQNTEWLFVLHQIASLREESGRGIAAVSTGTLFNEASRPIRDRLLAMNCIAGVIALPPGILPHTAAPLSLLIIDKRRRRNGNDGVLMIQADPLFGISTPSRTTPVPDQLTAEVIQQIVSLAHRETDHSCCRVVSMEELLRNDSILLPSRYIFQDSVPSPFGPLLVDLQPTEKWPPLQTVAEKIYRGAALSKSDENPDGKLYHIINYASVQDGKLQMDSLKECRTCRNLDHALVRPNDILVSCKGPQIKVCIVPEGVENVLLSISFIGIRLKEREYSPEFLLQYLTSPAGLAYLQRRQVSTSIVTLKNSDLAQMPVPPLSLAEQEAAIWEYASVRNGIEAQVRRLYQHLLQKRWALYQTMGLGAVLKKLKEDQS